MSVKQKVLELFENNKGADLSGEEMAGLLGVSRKMCIRDRPETVSCRYI